MLNIIQGADKDLIIRVTSQSGDPFDLTDTDMLRACFKSISGGSLYRYYLPYTGHTENGSDIITFMSSTDLISEGDPFVAPGIPDSTFVLYTPNSVAPNNTDPNTVKLSKQATASSHGGATPEIQKTVFDPSPPDAGTFSLTIEGYTLPTVGAGIQAVDLNGALAAHFGAGVITVTGDRPTGFIFTWLLIYGPRDLIIIADNSLTVGGSPVAVNVTREQTGLDGVVDLAIGWISIVNALIGKIKISLDEDFTNQMAVDTQSFELKIVTGDIHRTDYVQFIDSLNVIARLC